MKDIFIIDKDKYESLQKFIEIFGFKFLSNLGVKELTFECSFYILN